MAYAGKAGGKHPSVRPGPSNSRPVGVLATGLAIGLAVGVGVALLFAPLEGADARSRIRRKLRRAGFRGRDAWDELRFELLGAQRKLKRARLRARLRAENSVLDAST